jgi:hypothetical protein
MISALPAIFSLLVAAAGWYYIFYSSAATRLAPIEHTGINRMRIFLRRAGGVVMILLATTFYAGIVAVERQNGPAAAGFLFAVACLMIVVISLALVDLRLTRGLRKSQGKEHHP